jgi:cell division protein FtsQ
VIGQPATLEVETPRRGVFHRRRGNRRAVVQHRSLLNLVGSWFARLGRVGYRVLRVLSKLLLLVGVLAGCLWGGRWMLRHIVDSPRFQVKAIEFSATPHLGQGDIMDLAGVSPGDKLLGLDTDAVAARIASHPWVASVRASRRLPSSLVIEVVERHAMAVAALSGLYLVDENGRPFKRASMEEAEGLPVLTGVERPRYAQMREVSEAAFREALALLSDYRRKPGRPAVGEISIDPGFGFSLLLLEGGAEIRLGRENFSKKLAQLDQIFEAVMPKEMGGLSALRIVHLDLPESGRVPVLLRSSGHESSVPLKQDSPKLAKN